MTDLFRTIAIIVVHTPVWVWGLYALLLFLGFQRTHDSIVPIARMLILPLVVSLLAISSVAGAGLSALPAIGVALLIGSIAGWQIERDGSVRRLADGRLWLRGEWWSLAQVALMLVLRYVANVVAIMNPVLSANFTWHVATLFISSALSAVFLGRTAARLRVYFSPAPHIRRARVDSRATPSS